eukprot:2293571-Amphidinium_carterae.4
MATWRIEDWSRPDNLANNTLCLDHSVATWITTPTQWHLSFYTAVTMLNTRSLSVGFKHWCDNNGLSDIRAKLLEADQKTIKPQSVTADNGLETVRQTTRRQCHSTSGTMTMLSQQSCDTACQQWCRHAGQQRCDDNARRQ